MCTDIMSVSALHNLCTVSVHCPYRPHWLPAREVTSFFISIIDCNFCQLTQNLAFESRANSAREIASIQWTLISIGSASGKEHRERPPPPLPRRCWGAWGFVPLAVGRWAHFFSWRWRGYMHIDLIWIIESCTRHVLHINPFVQADPPCRLQ